MSSQIIGVIAGFLIAFLGFQFYPMVVSGIQQLETQTVRHCANNDADASQYREGATSASYGRWGNITIAAGAAGACSVTTTIANAAVQLDDGSTFAGPGTAGALVLTGWTAQDALAILGMFLGITKLVLSVIPLLLLVGVVVGAVSLISDAALGRTGGDTIAEIGRTVILRVGGLIILFVIVLVLPMIWQQAEVAQQATAGYNATAQFSNIDNLLYGVFPVLSLVGSVLIVLFQVQGQGRRIIGGAVERFS